MKINHVLPFVDIIKSSPKNAREFARNSWKSGWESHDQAIELAQKYPRLFARQVLEGQKNASGTASRLRAVNNLFHTMTDLGGQVAHSAGNFIAHPPFAVPHLSMLPHDALNQAMHQGIQGLNLLG